MPGRELSLVRGTVPVKRQRGEPGHTRDTGTGTACPPRPNSATPFGRGWQWFPNGESGPGTNMKNLNHGQAGTGPGFAVRADSCDPVNRLNECGRCGGLARSRVCRSVDSTDLVAHDEEPCNRQLRTVRDSRVSVKTQVKSSQVKSRCSPGSAISINSRPPPSRWLPEHIR